MQTAIEISPTLKETIRELLAIRASALADIAGVNPLQTDALWFGDRVRDISYANRKVAYIAAYCGLRPADLIALCS